MRAARRRHFGWALWLAGALAVPSMVMACPTCKDALSGDPVATALSWTTLLLIAVPLLLVGSIGGWVFFLYWRAARPAAAGATGESARAVPWHSLWTGKESET